MSWSALSSVFFLSTLKFMFAPFAGIGFSMSFFETMLTCFLGGSVSAAFFFFSSKFFIERHKRKQALQKHKPVSPSAAKRKRQVNRMIIKLKWKLGQYGICYFAPLLLSIPVGSIICAKFFIHKKQTYPLMVICLGINSFLLTSMAYFIF